MEKPTTWPYSFSDIRLLPLTERAGSMVAYTPFVEINTQKATFEYRYVSMTIPELLIASAIIIYYYVFNTLNRLIFTNIPVMAK